MPNFSCIYLQKTYVLNIKHYKTMIYDLEKKIELRRKELGLMKKDIYEGLGMTGTGYNDMLKRGSTSVKT